MPGLVSIFCYHKTMKELVLLNVIGHPGAGKSEVCKRLKDRWGFEIYSPSSLIRDFANRKDLRQKVVKIFLVVMSL